MFSLSSDLQFQLYSQPTDMRKSFDGLCGIVQEQLGEPATGGDVYIFINKLRNKMKLLHWQSGGFMLYYKRLERGTFEHLNYDVETGSYLLSYSQMVLLVDGISIKNLEQKKRYK